MIEAIAGITPSSVALFFLYSLIALLVALVGRISVGNMGEKAKNQAVSAVTSMVADAVKESRDLSGKLLDEREIRAKLEGKVETIMAHATEEKRRADTAYEKLAKQDNQIEKLSSEVKQLTSDLKSIRERLTIVESEKKALEEEKHKLENDLSTQGVEYRNLMASIQERIDKAVADVREELRVKYEERIIKLETEIRLRDEEIVKLTALLKESESHEHESPSQSIPFDLAAPAAPAADTGTGIDGSATGASPDSGDSGGKPSGGGSPSA